MENSKSIPIEGSLLDPEINDGEENTSLSGLLKDFTDIPNIDQAWTFASNCEEQGPSVMFSVSQTNLMLNKKRKYVLSSHILNDGDNNFASFQWAPFPIEMTGVSAMVPSPSGSKLLIVRNSGTDSTTSFEIWNPSQVEKEFHIPQSTHGSLYTDEWFGGISWNHDETLIAYVAEEPIPKKPTFNCSGFHSSSSKDENCGSWKGQGEWEEDWGETYGRRRLPALFVININSGEVCSVEGIGRSLSVGQVIWSSSKDMAHLVFVGWPSDGRKLGIKYCTSRRCALYAIGAPFSGVDPKEASLITITRDISSAFFPRFSPDGKFLVFLSAKSAVDSGAHVATDSLHRVKWPADGESEQSAKIFDVVPIVMRVNDFCFPGLYCTNVLSNPWLQDGSTMILSSAWGSTQAILAINILSGVIQRVDPGNSIFSWNILTVYQDNLIAECSSPVDVPKIKYGIKASMDDKWSWLEVSNPIFKCSEKVKTLISTRQCSIIKIPVKYGSDSSSKGLGASEPFEAIFVSSKSQKIPASDPLIVVLHGGPHSVSLSTFSKSFAFLFSIGYSLLIVNYRGSLGFGEEALQSIPGKIGSQDVEDVLTAVNYVVDMGLANPSKIVVTGNSHGGFLTAHLISQAPDKFAAAVPRNPVCNFALMVGTSDIPDWCYVESFGCEAKSYFTEAPSAEHLVHFYEKSPISLIHKVKTPTLFLLGAKDLRVPVSNGLQYARALREKGVEVKVIMFPDDEHALERPCSEFEGFLNMAMWFNKYCK